MKCEQCKIVEMLIQTRNENEITYKCPKCGQTVIVNIRT